MTWVEGNLIRSDARARRYVAAALACTAAIIAVEALLVHPGHLLAAQIADALLVLALVNAGPGRDAQLLSARAAAALAALRGLALVPLMRVVVLGLPMRDWSEPIAVLAVALPIGLVALRLAPVVRLCTRRLFSVRPTLADLYAVCAGAMLGPIAYRAGAPTLWPDGAADDRIALGIAAAIVAACVEELVFRGLIQGTLQRAAGRVGMLAAGAIFASTYLDAGSTALVLTFALAGVAFGHAVARTGALTGALAGHVLLVVGAGAVSPALFDEYQLAGLGEPQTTIALSIAIAIAVVIACWQPLDRASGQDRASERDIDSDLTTASAAAAAEAPKHAGQGRIGPRKPTAPTVPAAALTELTAAPAPNAASPEAQAKPAWPPKPAAAPKRPTPPKPAPAAAPKRPTPALTSKSQRRAAYLAAAAQLVAARRTAGTPAGDAKLADALAAHDAAWDALRAGGG